MNETQAHAAPAELHAALSDDALHRASSPAVFQRGKTYASSGAVEVLDVVGGPPATIHAQVTGTDTYTTEVWIEDDAVHGSCDCPNGEDGWFCKHQVAVALVWRDRLAGQTAEVEEGARKKVQASVKRARTVKDRRQALRDFMHGLEASVLADKLLELADADPDIARELQQWRKVSEAPAEVADLKPLIGEILAPGHGFISWREIHGYTRRAQAVLPLLQQARQRDPGAAAALSLHALRRAWSVLAQADDSNGEIGGLCEAIGTQWVASLDAAGPQLGRDNHLGRWSDKHDGRW